MRYWREVLHEDVMRAHEKWLYRNRVGEGRLLLAHEVLREARVSGMTFDYAKIEACDFDGAMIVYAHFNYCEVLDCTFIKSTLKSSRFLHALLQRVKFDQSDLRNCWYADARVVECTFDATDLSEGNLVRASVADCSFRSALLDTQMDLGTFERCDFRGARLSYKAYGSKFVECDLRGANVEGLRLKDTVFTRCKFSGVIGKPTIEGPLELNEADFSSDEAPASGTSSAEQLRALWLKT